MEEVFRLLAKWRTVPANCTVKLIDTVLLHGTSDATKAAPPQLEWLVRFVAAHMMGLMAERLPQSHSVYAEQVLAALQKEPLDSLVLLQKLVTAPHQLTESHLTHMLLYYIDPEMLETAQSASYLAHCHEVRSVLLF